jgi:transcriptional regulator
MYKLPHYTINERTTLIDFCKEIPFAFVTGIGSEFPVATQLPLDIVEENGTLLLRGHLMRKTDHHLAFDKNENVLVIFNSPHAYIDANWYTEPAQGSTVNYISVHAKGKIKFTDDAGTYAAVKKITEKHIDVNSAAGFKNISEDYLTTMIKAIVGFTIEVEDLQGVFKLSQNKLLEDKKNIIKKLRQRNMIGDNYIATKMEGLLK